MLSTCQPDGVIYHHKMHTLAVRLSSLCLFCVLLCITPGCYKCPVVSLSFYLPVCMSFSHYACYFFLCPSLSLSVCLLLPLLYLFLSLRLSFWVSPLSRLTTPSVCLSLYLSVHLFIYVSYISLSFYVIVCLSVCGFVCMCLFLSVYLVSVCLYTYICFSVDFFVCYCLCLPVCLSLSFHPTLSLCLSLDSHLSLYSYNYNN